MHRCKMYLLIGAALVTGMTGNKAVAESTPDNKNKPELEMPDEAFLEFLANMEIVEGETTDPLDMLEVDEKSIALNAKGQPVDKNEATKAQPAKPNLEVEDENTTTINKNPEAGQLAKSWEVQ